MVAISERKKLNIVKNKPNILCQIYKVQSIIRVSSNVDDIVLTLIY